MQPKSIRLALEHNRRAVSAGFANYEHQLVIAHIGEKMLKVGNFLSPADATLLHSVTPGCTHAQVTDLTRQINEMLEEADHDAQK